MDHQVGPTRPPLAPQGLAHIRVGHVPEAGKAVSHSFEKPGNLGLFINFISNLIDLIVWKLGVSLDLSYNNILIVLALCVGDPLFLCGV